MRKQKSQTPDGNKMNTPDRQNTEALDRSRPNSREVEPYGFGRLSVRDLISSPVQQHYRYSPINSTTTGFQSKHLGSPDERMQGDYFETSHKPKYFLSPNNESAKKINYTEPGRFKSSDILSQITKGTPLSAVSNANMEYNSMNQGENNLQYSTFSPNSQQRHWTSEIMSNFNAHSDISENSSKEQSEESLNNSGEKTGGKAERKTPQTSTNKIGSTTNKGGTRERPNQLQKIKNIVDNQKKGKLEIVIDSPTHVSKQHQFTEQSGEPSALPSDSNQINSESFRARNKKVDAPQSSQSQKTNYSDNTTFTRTQNPQSEKNFPKNYSTENDNQIFDENPGFQKDPSSFVSNSHHNKFDVVGSTTSKSSVQSLYQSLKNESQNTENNRKPEGMHVRSKDGRIQGPQQKTSKPSQKRDGPQSHVSQETEKDDNYSGSHAKPHEKSHAMDLPRRHDGELKQATQTKSSDGDDIELSNPGLRKTNNQGGDESSSSTSSDNERSRESPKNTNPTQQSRKLKNDRTKGEVTPVYKQQNISSTNPAEKQHVQAEIKQLSKTNREKPIIENYSDSVQRREESMQIPQPHGEEKEPQLHTNSNKGRDSKKIDRTLGKRDLPSANHEHSQPTTLPNKAESSSLEKQKHPGKGGYPEILSQIKKKTEIGGHLSDISDRKDSDDFVSETSLQFLHSPTKQQKNINKDNDSLDTKVEPNHSRERKPEARHISDKNRNYKEKTRLSPIPSSNRTDEMTDSADTPAKQKDLNKQGQFDYSETQSGHENEFQDAESHLHQVTAPLEDSFHLDAQRIETTTNQRNIQENKPGKKGLRDSGRLPSAKEQTRTNGDPRSVEAEDENDDSSPIDPSRGQKTEKEQAGSKDNQVRVIDKESKYPQKRSVPISPSQGVQKGHDEEPFTDERTLISGPDRAADIIIRHSKTKEHEPREKNKQYGKKDRNEPVTDARDSTSNNPLKKVHKGAIEGQIARASQSGHSSDSNSSDSLESFPDKADKAKRLPFDSSKNPTRPIDKRYGEGKKLPAAIENQNEQAPEIIPEEKLASKLVTPLQEVGSHVKSRPFEEIRELQHKTADDLLTKSIHPNTQKDKHAPANTKDKKEKINSNPRNEKEIIASNPRKSVPHIEDVSDFDKDVSQDISPPKNIGEDPDGLELSSIHHSGDESVSVLDPHHFEGKVHSGGDHHENKVLDPVLKGTSHNSSSNLNGRKGKQPYYKQSPKSHGSEEEAEFSHQKRPISESAPDPFQQLEEKSQEIGRIVSQKSKLDEQEPVNADEEVKLQEDQEFLVSSNANPSILHEDKGAISNFPLSKEAAKQANFTPIELRKGGVKFSKQKITIQPSIEDNSSEADGAESDRFSELQEKSQSQTISAEVKSFEQGEENSKTRDQGSIKEALPLKGDQVLKSKDSPQKELKAPPSGKDTADRSNRSPHRVSEPSESITQPNGNAGPITNESKHSTAKSETRGKLKKSEDNAEHHVESDAEHKEPLVETLAERDHFDGGLVRTTDSFHATQETTQESALSQNKQKPTQKEELASIFKHSQRSGDKSQSNQPGPHNKISRNEPTLSIDTFEKGAKKQEDSGEHAPQQALIDKNISNTQSDRDPRKKDQSKLTENQPHQGSDLKRDDRTKRIHPDVKTTSRSEEDNELNTKQREPSERLGVPSKQIIINSQGPENPIALATINEGVLSKGESPLTKEFEKKGPAAKSNQAVRNEPDTEESKMKKSNKPFESKGDLISEKRPKNAASPHKQALIKRKESSNQSGNDTPTFILSKNDSKSGEILEEERVKEPYTIALSPKGSNSKGVSKLPEAANIASSQTHSPSKNSNQPKDQAESSGVKQIIPKNKEKIIEPSKQQSSNNKSPISSPQKQNLKGNNSQNPSITTAENRAHQNPQIASKSSGIGKVDGKNPSPQKKQVPSESLKSKPGAIDLEKKDHILNKSGSKREAVKKGEDFCDQKQYTRDKLAADQGAQIVNPEPKETSKEQQLSGYDPQERVKNRLNTPSSNEQHGNKKNAQNKGENQIGMGSEQIPYRETAITANNQQPQLTLVKETQRSQPTGDVTPTSNSALNKGQLPKGQRKTNADNKHQLSSEPEMVKEKVNSLNQKSPSGKGSSQSQVSHNIVQAKEQERKKIIEEDKADQKPHTTTKGQVSETLATKNPANLPSNTQIQGNNASDHLKATPKSSSGIAKPSPSEKLSSNPSKSVADGRLEAAHGEEKSLSPKKTITFGIETTLTVADKSGASPHKPTLQGQVGLKIESTIGTSKNPRQEKIKSDGSNISQQDQTKVSSEVNPVRGEKSGDSVSIGKSQKPQSQVQKVTQSEEKRNPTLKLGNKEATELERIATNKDSANEKYLLDEGKIEGKGNNLNTNSNTQQTKASYPKERRNIKSTKASDAQKEMTSSSDDSSLESDESTQKKVHPMVHRKSNEISDSHGNPKNKTSSGGFVKQQDSRDTSSATRFERENQNRRAAHEEKVPSEEMNRSQDRFDIVSGSPKEHLLTRAEPNHEQKPLQAYEGKGLKALKSNEPAETRDLRKNKTEHSDDHDDKEVETEENSRARLKNSGLADSNPLNKKILNKPPMNTEVTHSHHIQSEDSHQPYPQSSHQTDKGGEIKGVGRDNPQGQKLISGQAHLRQSRGEEPGTLEADPLFQDEHGMKRTSLYGPPARESYKDFLNPHTMPEDQRNSQKPPKSLEKPQESGKETVTRNADTKSRNKELDAEKSSTSDQETQPVNLAKQGSLNEDFIKRQSNATHLSSELLDDKRQVSLFRGPSLFASGDIHQFDDGNYPISAILHQDEESEQSSFRDEKYIISRLFNTASAKELLKLQTPSSVKRMKASLQSSPEKQELMESEDLHGDESDKTGADGSGTTNPTGELKTREGQRKNEMIKGSTNPAQSSKYTEGREQNNEFSQERVPYSKDSGDRINDNHKIANPQKQIIEEEEEEIAAVGHMQDNLQPDNPKSRKMSSGTMKTENKSQHYQGTVQSLPLKNQRLEKPSQASRSQNYRNSSDKNLGNISDQLDGFSQYAGKDERSQENQGNSSVDGQQPSHERGYFESSDSKAAEQFALAAERLTDSQHTRTRDENISANKVSELRSCSRSNQFGEGSSQEARSPSKHSFVPEQDSRERAGDKMCSETSKPNRKPGAKEKTKDVAHNQDKTPDSSTNEKDSQRKGNKPNALSKVNLNATSEKDILQQEASSVHYTKPSPFVQRASLDIYFGKDSLAEKSTAIMGTGSPKGRKSETEGGVSEALSHSAGEEPKDSHRAAHKMEEKLGVKQKMPSEGAESQIPQNSKNNSLTIEGLRQKSPQGSNKKKKAPLKKPLSGKMTFMEDPRSDTQAESSAGDDNYFRGTGLADKEKRNRRKLSKSKQMPNNQDKLFNSQRALFQDQGELSSTHAEVGSHKRSDLKSSPQPKAHVFPRRISKEEESNLEFSPDSARFTSQDEFTSQIMVPRDSLSHSPTHMNLERLLSLALETARHSDSHVANNPKSNNNETRKYHQQELNSGHSDNLETPVSRKNLEENKMEYTIDPLKQVSKGLNKQQFAQNLPERHEPGLSSKKHAHSRPEKVTKDRADSEREEENSSEKLSGNSSDIRGYPRQSGTQGNTSKAADIGFDRGLLRGPKRTILVSADGYQEQEQDQEQESSSEEDYQPRFPTFDGKRKPQGRKNIQPAEEGANRQQSGIRMGGEWPRSPGKQQTDEGFENSDNDRKKYPSLHDAMLESSYYHPDDNGRRFRSYEEDDEVHQASSSHHLSNYPLLAASRRQQHDNGDRANSQDSSVEEFKEEYLDDVEMPHYEKKGTGSLNSVEGDLNTPSFVTVSPDVRNSLASNDSRRSHNIMKSLGSQRSSFFPNPATEGMKRQSDASSQRDSDVHRNRYSTESDSKGRPPRVNVPKQDHPNATIVDYVPDDAIPTTDDKLNNLGSRLPRKLSRGSGSFDKEALDYIHKLYGKKYADCLRFCYVLAKIFEKRVGIAKAQAFSSLLKRSQTKASMKRAASTIQVIPDEGLLGSPFGEPSMMWEPHTLTNLDISPDIKQGFGLNVKFYWILDKIIGRKLRKNKGFAFDAIKSISNSRKGGLSDDDYFVLESLFLMLKRKLYKVLEHAFTQIRRDSYAKLSLSTSQVYMSRILDHSGHQESPEEKFSLKNSQLIQKHEKALAMLMANKLNDFIRNIKRQAWIKLESYKKKQNRHTYHPSMITSPSQDSLPHKTTTIIVKSHPNLDSIDFQFNKQDRAELLKKILSWKIEDEQLIKNRYLTFWKYLTDVHKIRSQKILHQLQNASKIIRRYLFKLFIYRIQRSVKAENNVQNLVGHYVEALRKKGFEALAALLLQRKKAGFQAIQRHYSLYKSLKAESKMQQKTSNLLYFAQTLNYLLRLHMNRQLSFAFLHLRQVKFKHAIIKRMVTAIDNSRKRAVHRVFEAILKGSNMSSILGKVKALEVLTEKLKGLQRKRMKWAFGYITANSSRVKNNDYAAKIAMLEQCLKRYASARLSNALRALELNAVHKKNKILAATHILLKLMLFKDNHEMNLKEYAFDMIRMDGEETFIKNSNKNYGYTNGLYKLHYLILAVEFKRYRNIVSQIKENQMQISIGLKYIEKVTRKTSRKLLAEAFRLLSEKDADSSTRYKKLRIKRMVNSIMKNLPVFMRMENILSNKRKACLSTGFK